MRLKKIKKQLLALLALIPFMPFAAQANVQSKPIGTVVWDKSAFSPASSTQVPTLYLGAKVADAANPAHSLARATLGFDNAGAAAVIITPLAPTPIKLNGVDGQVNVLNNAVIPNLTLFNSTLPVVTNGVKVYMVTKPQDGTEVITNDPDVVKDAGGVNEAGAIKALAASGDTIFAAVSANGTTWEDPTVAGDNRGIAVIQPANPPTSLLVRDATNFANPAKAQEFILTPDKNFVAFDDVNATIDTAELGPNVDMFWNKNLQRLYVGLENVHRDDPAKEGGILGLVMGRIDPAGNGSLVLQPVVSDVKKALFYDGATPNVIDRVVGFYADGVVANDGDKPFSVSVKQMRSMRTTTGKDYVIVNSNVGFAGVGGQNISGIFALPVLGEKLADGTAVGAAEQGTLSKVAVATGVATFDGVPAVFDQMPTADKAAVRVGSIDAINISDIFVEGDAVYMCGNPVGKGHDQAGIFVSTALFDENGSIRSWTPAQRVYGSIDQVWGGGLDTVLGNFYALTSQGIDTDADRNKINTVKITQWGKTNSNTNLIELLEQLFPLEKGGLVAMETFDIFTPGFNQLFSMSVAVGTDKIALIQTGKAVGGQFVLETNFVVDTNVFVYDTTIPALAEIAPFTGAEVSRMIGDDEGWLFVCGCGGVAVLSNEDDAAADVSADNPLSPAGRGWPSAAGLDMLRAGGVGLENFFPGGDIVNTNWSWKKLVEENNPDAFKQVLKLTASAGRMYVVTLEGVFFFDMVAGKFDGVPTTPLGDVLAANLPEGTLVADLSVLNPNDATDPANADDNRGIIGTNKGLIASDLNGAIGILPDKVGDIALHLQQLGDISSQAPQTANVYVLGTDFENNNDKLFRFDVPNATAALNVLAKPVTVPNADGLIREFHSSKQSFDTDGTFVRSTLPKNFDQVELLTLHHPVTGTGGIDITPLLELDLNENKNISGVGRDTASGTINVPGDWALRVNK